MRSAGCKPSHRRVIAATALAAALVIGPPAASQPLRESTQARLHGKRVVVTVPVRIMDGDTGEIAWGRADIETVRVLGIDAPELRDRGTGIPSRLGAEARGFARGAFAVARRVELLRAARLDRYGRTLGYFYLDGGNYSALLLEARLARETISRFGDNGFPREAAEVLEAARRVGPSARARR
jgi:micrococcal nuclease